MNIHPTAIISDKAELGENLQVGPYSIIEEGTRIGNNCEIAAQAQLRSGTVIGNDCYIGSGAVISADPQFVGFDREISSGVEMGDANLIREYVTMHRSIREGGCTRIGSHNYFMNGAHLGHDCEVGDHNILANNVLLGGHVTMGSHCFLGGASVFHQFVRIGDYVMAQGMAGMSTDTPPFAIAAGVNGIAGINVIGLRRSGFSAAARKEIKEAFGMIYQKKMPTKEVVTHSKQRDWGDGAQIFFDFIEEESKKGLCLRLRRSK